MASVTVAEHLKAPPDKVWELIGKFDALHKWAPGVKDARAQGTAVGAMRTVTMSGGDVVTERLVSRSDQPRAYTYSIEKSGMPLANHISTLMVMDHGDGSCTVSLVCTFEPLGSGKADELQRAIGDFYRAGVANLKKRFG